MANIPNTEYITVNANGIFVGGKPATTYRGQEIYDIDSVKHVFEWMQAQHPNIAEFHIGAFVTPGEYAKPGNPDGAFGPNAWCRVKYKNGSSSPWVFDGTCSSAADCAYFCAILCAYYVRLARAFGLRCLVWRMINKIHGKNKTH